MSHRPDWRFEVVYPDGTKEPLEGKVAFEEWMMRAVEIHHIGGWTWEEFKLFLDDGSTVNVRQPKNGPAWQRVMQRRRQLLGLEAM